MMQLTIPNMILERRKRSLINAGISATIVIKNDNTCAYIGTVTNDIERIKSWANVHSVYGNDSFLCVNFDGTVSIDNKFNAEIKLWTNIVAACAGSKHIIGLKNDGTCIAVGDNTYKQCNIKKWIDIVDIICTDNRTIGLRSNGTCVAVGDNSQGQCDVKDWNDIVAIACAPTCTIGLKSNGTCVATGNNVYKQCNISDWTNIVDISCGYYHTVGLKSDGTCVATGYDNDYYDYGQCDVSAWTDIIAIDCGRWHTVGLKSSGACIAVGRNQYGQCDVYHCNNIISDNVSDALLLNSKECLFSSNVNSDIIDCWNNIKNIVSYLISHHQIQENSVYVTDNAITNLIAQKRLLASNIEDNDNCSYITESQDNLNISGNNSHIINKAETYTIDKVNNCKCNVSTCTNIIKIVRNSYGIAGLKTDGTCVYIGKEINNCPHISTWTDIIDIDNVYDVIVGLKKNGTCVMYGNIVNNIFG